MKKTKKKFKKKIKKILERAALEIFTIFFENFLFSHLFKGKNRELYLSFMLLQLFSYFLVFFVVFFTVFSFFHFNLTLEQSFWSKEWASIIAAGAFFFFPCRGIIRIFDSHCALLHATTLRTRKWPRWGYAIEKIELKFKNSRILNLRGLKFI